MPSTIRILILFFIALVIALGGCSEEMKSQSLSTPETGQYSIFHLKPMIGTVKNKELGKTCTLKATYYAYTAAMALEGTIDLQNCFEEFTPSIYMHDFKLNLVQDGQRLQAEGVMGGVLNLEGLGEARGNKLYLSLYDQDDISYQSVLEISPVTGI